MTTGRCCPSCCRLSRLVVWAAAGLLALCGAAVYAELGTMMPRVGGEYVYLSRAYGPAMGFLSGLGRADRRFRGADGRRRDRIRGLSAQGVPGVGRQPMLSPGRAFTVAHMADVRLGARLQAGLSVVVVAVMCCSPPRRSESGAATGATWHRRSPARSLRAGGLAIAAGWPLGWSPVSYSYSGWNGAAYIAGEVRDPAARSRALVLATGLVTLLYLALNLAFLYAAPAGALAGRLEVAHTAAVALFGPRGAIVISSMVALTSAGFVSAMLMSGLACRRGDGP